MYSPGAKEHIPSLPACHLICFCFLYPIYQGYVSFFKDNGGYACLSCRCSFEVYFIDMLAIIVMLHETC